MAAPAVSEAAPPTSSAPESVMAPLAVTVSPPEIVEAPNTTALASCRVTLFADVNPMVEKLFVASSSTTLFAAPAVMVAAPVTLSCPVSVTAPPAVTPNAPPTFIWLSVTAAEWLRVAAPVPVVTAAEAVAGEVAQLVDALAGQKEGAAA